jgi:hypothetical protein
MIAERAGMRRRASARAGKLPDHLQAGAIELGFVQPGVTCGHGLGRNGIAGADEGERQAHRSRSTPDGYL